MAVMEPGNELGEPLNERQIKALQELVQLGASPRESVDAPYSKDLRIRAWQLIYEGRLGGPGRGQGRKRKPRASELLAERVRRKVDRMEAALDRALDSDNEKVALDAVRAGLKIEHDEASLKLAEEKQDAELDRMTKEDLVADLIALAGDPSISAAAQGYIDLPASSVTEIEKNDDTSGTWKANFANSPAPAGVRSNGRSTRSDGRGTTASNRSQTKNPWAEAKKRRSTD